MSFLVGTILGGSLVFAVGMYTVKVGLLSVKALRGQLKSDSMGMKRLRHQKWNPAYNKYVMKSEPSTVKRLKFQEWNHAYNKYVVG